MTRSAFRRWFWIHKWSSLVCTAFLLLLCLTGVPLIFREELGDLLDDSQPYAAVADTAPRVGIDTVLATSRAIFPGETVVYVFVDDDEPKIIVSMASSWQDYAANLKAAHWIKFDAHTGQVLKQSKPFDADGIGFLDVVFKLHKDLFAGLAGELFLGSMALLFVVALASGIAIYGPFMRRLAFATVRTDRSRRVKWLDLHNLLGVVTLAWMLVVGLTGVVNELSTPLFALWQQTDVKAMLAPMRGRPVPSVSEMSSPEAAFETVKAAAPDMTATSILFPGSPFGSPYHYVVWTKGRQQLTSRLFSPFLIDARTGKLAASVAMPWYLRALEVSRPLHFGDYGGTPLKILWAILDFVAIGVLGSGLYLWIARGQSPASRPEAESDLAASRAVPASTAAQGAAE
jgi:uncharacterized iron-regulated membrane protein